MIKSSHLFYLILAMFMLWPLRGDTHELRPAIATVEFTKDGAIALGITLNLEAAIAGIGTAHKDTSESPAAADYNKMRAMPPAELSAMFDRFAAEFLNRISLKSDSGLVRLRIVGVEIPVVGDTALPRFSKLALRVRRHAMPGICIGALIPGSATASFVSESPRRTRFAPPNM